MGYASSRRELHSTFTLVITFLFQNFCCDWHCAVDGVGNDGDEGLGAVVSDSSHKGLDNLGIDIEQVIPGHARLPWNTCECTERLHSQKEGKKNLLEGVEVKALANIGLRTQNWVAIPPRLPSLTPPTTGQSKVVSESSDSMLCSQSQELEKLRREELLLAVWKTE